MDQTNRIILQGVDNTGPAIQSAKQNVAALGNQAQMSAKATAAAMREVPAQITDIVVGLSSGQKPLTVLLQQGGQLKDMFGGVVPAAKALGTYLLSLLNPMVLVAGAAGAIAVAYAKGASESEGLNKVLILTGNYAGLTADKLNGMAKALATGSTTRGEAASALVEVLSTGKVAASQLDAVTASALQMSKTADVSLKDAIQMFVQLGEEPVQASAKLNAQYHYLTQSVFEQIKALDEQGSREQAASLAQKSLADAMAQRGKQVQENLGYLETAWNAVSKAAKHAWDSMLGIGRTETLSERLERASAQLDEAQARIAQSGQFTSNGGGAATGGVRLGVGGRAQALAVIQRAQADMRDSFRAMEIQGGNASSAGTKAAAEEAAIDATGRVNKLQDQAKGQAAVNRELEKYRQDLERIRAVNPNSALLDPKAVKAGEKAIRDAHAGSEGENAIDARLKALQGKLDQDVRATSASLAQKKADYDAGLITTKQYLDQEYEVKQEALEREFAIARQQEEIARGKKNVAAQEQYKNEQKKILDEMQANFSQHANAVRNDAVKAQRAVAEYQRGLNAQVKSRQEGIDDTLAGAGLSARQREEQQRIQEVQRDYEKRAEDLKRNRAKGEAHGGISQEEYDQELKDLDTYYKQRLAQEADYNAKSQTQRGDWTLGAKQAYAEYADAAGDAATQSHKVFTDVMQGMEDALVQFATTGKLNFRALANSIIADLVRMQAKAAVTKLFAPGSTGGSLLQQAGNFFLGGGGGGGSAGGIGASDLPMFTAAAKGNVFQSAGLSAYSNTIVNRPTMFAFANGAGLMGEAGPEAIMPLRRGRDGRLGVDAAAIGGGGGDSQITIVNNTSAQIGRVTERRIAPGERALIIEEAIDTFSAHLGNANSRPSQAMRANFKVQRNR